MISRKRERETEGERETERETEIAHRGEAARCSTEEHVLLSENEVGAESDVDRGHLLTRSSHTTQMILIL